MVANIAVGVLVVGWLIARQLRTRQVGDTGPRLMLVLAVIGLVDTVHAAHGHHVHAAGVVLVVAGLLMGAALGAWRATTVRLWRDANGVAWRRGTVATGVLWVVSLGSHLLLDVAVDHVSGVSGFGTAGILLYLAVTLGVQREVLRWRAGQLTAGSAPARTL